MRRFFFSGFFLFCGCLAVWAASDDPRRFVDRGRELFDFGRWSDARHEFLIAREMLDPADRAAGEEIDFLLAACAVELGSEDAEGALRRFIIGHPGSVHNNEAFFALGSYYCAHGDMRRARESFAAVDYRALSAARREQFDIRMGYAEFTDGNFDSAYRYFDRIPKGSKYADHALYYISYIAYVRGDYERAKQGFFALGHSEAYGELVPYYLLQIEFHQGNYKYVVDTGDELARGAVPRRRAELQRVIAEACFRLEDFAATLDHLQAFEDAGGEYDRETDYLCGFSLYRTARYDEAVEHLRKACGAEDALTQNASYHLADCYLRAGDKQAAMQAFAMASDERFDAEVAEDALFNYAKLQYESGGGAFNGAINLLSRYVERHPSTARADEARALLIAAYYNSRDFDAAYRAIKASSSMNAEMRAALQQIAYFRGLEAFQAGDLKAARRSLEESAAVNVSPKYTALSAFWQGEIAFTQGDHAVAAAKYNAYIARAPRSEREYAFAWYNLGYCSFSANNLARAGEAFKKFLAVYPNKDRYAADARNRLGDVHYAGRDFEAAVAEYARAIAMDTPEKDYAAYKRALALGLLGRAEQKQQALQRIAAAGTGDYADAASYELGRSYIEQERYAQGAKQLESFIADYPSSPRRVQALSDLGLAYLNLGDRKKSLHYYDQVVASSPRSFEAREAMQGIRDIYVSAGDVDGYFDYAARAGMESDLTALSRDSLSFAAAQKLYLADRHEVAAKSLRSYVRSYPKGSYKVEALYYLSDCYLRLGQRREAIETLSSLSELGVNQYSVTVLEKLSAMTFADRLYDQAARAYRQLYDVAPTAADRQKAMTGYVRATVAGGDARQIETMAADVCAHPDAGADALREARFAWAEQLRARGKRDEAAEHYRQLASEVRTREGSAAAYYLIEEMFAGGDTEGAEKAIFAFSERGPQAYWLAKAYILLGDVYVRKGDAFQARATWQSVADGYSHADDGIVEEAKARIRKMK